MDRSVFFVASLGWICDHANHAKRLGQGLLPVGTALGHLVPGCSILAKFRDPQGRVASDAEARLQEVAGSLYIKCAPLCDALREAARAPGRRWAALYIEGTPKDARCVAQVWDNAFFARLSRGEPTLRLGAYDLPPVSSTVVDVAGLNSSLYRAAAGEDTELFVAQASRFLAAPHVIGLLFGHVLAATSEDNLRFPVQVKKVADQLRQLLTSDSAPEGLRIRSVEKSHVGLWAEAEGLRFSFLDGGMARVKGFADVQPAALRVGVYSVRPGVVDPAEREKWGLRGFVLGDLVDAERRPRERPDLRRFYEAARLTLEPLSALAHLREAPDVRALFLHGPLLAQFTEYDEGAPSFLPFVAPRLLAELGVTREEVTASVDALPNDGDGAPMWNQFMAVYAFAAKRLSASPTPVAGVVERPTGRAATLAILESLAEGGVVAHRYVDRMRRELDSLDITDDFTFGCVLNEGEYVGPVPVNKNPTHRARPHWHPVVRQYPKANVLLLKTAPAAFPFRVELNEKGAAEAGFMARFLYHTARLLPGYAFPVGLDIADKYAKIPDWISRGISAELSAAVMRRALRTGDPRVVLNIRQLLAGAPRDFFFRPGS